MQGEVKREMEQLRDNRTCAWREDGMTNSRNLNQVECDVSVTKKTTSNSMQACSDLTHVVLELVRRVTVVIVHIGLEGVFVVTHTFALPFCS